MSKIDRVLGNDLWEKVFPNILLFLILKVYSIIHLWWFTFQHLSRGGSHFDLFSNCASKVDFVEKVREVWNTLITEQLGY